MVQLQKIEKRQLSSQTINRLIDWLSSDSIQVGDKLPSEPEIMEKLGVGRSTIREAIKVLEHLSFLDVRVGNGTYLIAKPYLAEPFLSRLRRADLKEVQYFKLGLEAQIAFLAAKNRTEEDIKVIHSKLMECTQALEQGDIEAFAKSDYEFHKAIAKSANTSLLYDFYLAVREITNVLELKLSKAEILDQHVFETHKKLFEGIKKGDTTQARLAWLEMDVFSH